MLKYRIMGLCYLKIQIIIQYTYFHENISNGQKKRVKKILVICVVK